MILGIDTSCYTTSMILIEQSSGAILFEKNVLLKVKEGSKGLRQSDGFYQHVHQLADSFQALTAIFDVSNLKAIAVTNAPRNVEGSYMPVFNAGVLFARNLSNAFRIPIYTFSHQEGHLMAALATSESIGIPSVFYGLHLSGGTTEFLRVHHSDGRFNVMLLGQTLDLNFGQLIDRIGVSLGLAFPCGKEMDQMAQRSTLEDYKRIKVLGKGTSQDHLGFNISGMENYFKKYIGEMPPEDLSRYVFNTIGHVIGESIQGFDPSLPVIISGGVASNSIIKTILKQRYKNLFFAKPEYSRDNALGIALLGRAKSLRLEAE